MDENELYRVVLSEEERQDFECGEADEGIRS